VNPPSYLIEFKSVFKKFGFFTANENISFGIRKNSVHSVIGENGAGKTTLMKILFGIYKKDSGNILINGNEVVHESPFAAIAGGISMLHQHFQLIEDFSVLENVILGKEKMKSFFLDFPDAKDTVNKLISRYSLGLDPESKVYGLSISEKQKVEILKMLYRNPDILIFDEPTAVLSPLEVEQFCGIVRKFKSEGKTVLLITHKLNEVKELSDNITVLRKGKVVYETDSVNFDISKISRAIVGSVNVPFVKTERKEIKGGELLLHLENVSYVKDKVLKLNNLNLKLYKNEIFGIIGIEGNGQSEIVELILGHLKKIKGRYSSLPSSVSIVPDDRIKKGMIGEFSIGENILLRNGSKKIFYSSKVDTAAEKIISEYDVRSPGIHSLMNELSGGNQQKAIFGREVELDNELLVFVHPTRGVDINASVFIQNMILEQRNSGKAVLLITSDLDEALLLSDRLGIMYKGRFIKKLQGETIRNADKECNENVLENIGRCMIGITDD
jgi:general nucleoside transport system ATP-binding protein